MKKISILGSTGSIGTQTLELVRLNNDENWRSLLGKPIYDLHSKDIELILRSIALLHEGDNYSPKMVTFLNSFSQKSKNFSDEKIQYLNDLFISFVRSCSELKEKAFFRNNRFSNTLFEAVFIAASDKFYKNNALLDDKISIESFENLKNDEKFKSYLLSGSSSKENISGRINRAKEIIKFIGDN